MKPPSGFRLKRAADRHRWSGKLGMRDVLIHDYIGVDLDEVWNVAFSRIPELQVVLERDLAEGSEGPARVS